jgi:hypothetical protein
MEAKYKAGEIVYERTHLTQKLIISHYADKLYYCKVYEAPERKPLVFFERDLVTSAMITIDE